MKPTRKAIRTFLIKGNQILAITYITNDYKKEFYDIPGDEIEIGEPGEQTAIRVSG